MPADLDSNATGRSANTAPGRTEPPPIALRVAPNGPIANSEASTIGPRIVLARQPKPLRQFDRPLRQRSDRMQDFDASLSGTAVMRPSSRPSTGMTD